MAASSDPASARSENIPLTAIRGVAALWVLGSHAVGVAPDHWPAWLRLPFARGYLGVDVFFVLSGFILAMVHRRLAIADIPLFLARRAARVYPLNLAVLGVTAALAATVLDLGTWARWDALPWFALMLQPYLPEPVLAWNVITWSVGIELACYLAFPAIVMTLRRLRSAVLALTVAGAALAACWVQARHAGAWWGAGALWRGAAGFLLGATLGMAAPRLPRPSRARLAGSELACGAGLVASALWEEPRGIPLFAGGLIVALWFDAGPVANLLRARCLQWIGQVSFSIYLLHGLILGQTGWMVGRLSNAMAWRFAMPVYFGGYVATVLLLSQVTYRFIEIPGHRLARAWPILLARIPARI